MKTHYTALALAVAAAASVTSLPKAVAQDDSMSLEEVIVTARRVGESLQDVPIAVTAFTETAIEDAGIERPEDYILLTPNVSMLNTVNAGDTQVTIRGIVSTRDAESTFAYVVDGVLITNPNGFNEELFDLQQIEVLRGPQGALYGRNAVAGAIIVNTRKPTNEVEGRLTVGVGNNDLTRGTAMISGPIVKDKLLGRLAISYRENDGQDSNRFTGEDDVIQNFEDTSVRGRLLWNASDKLTVDTQIGYSEVDSGAINFNAVTHFDVIAEAIGNPTLYGDVNDNDFQYIFNVPPENEQETLFLSVKADYEFDSGAVFTGIVAYDDLEESLLSDGTSAAFGGYSFGAPESASACLDSYNGIDPSILNPPFYAIQDGNPPGTYIGDFTLNAFLPPYSPTTCDGYQYQERNQESISLDMRITSPQDQRLRWMGGVYLLDIERDVVVAYGADTGQGFLAQPYVPPSGPNPTDLLFDDTFDTQVYSAYGQIAFDITDNQELAFALRYDREEREVSNNVPNVSSAQIFGGGAPINPAFDGSGTDSIPDRDETYSELQPKVSWRWIANDNISTYASYGVGFRSGGFNSIGSEAIIDANYGSFETAPQNIRDDYDEEISQTIEFGIKSSWMDNRLQLNAAVFYTEVEDSQFFSFYAGGFGLLRVVNNIDEVSIQGFEIDGKWLVTDYLSIYGGYGLTDGEIDENKNRPYTEGNELPYAPEYTANIGAQLDIPLGGDWAFVGRVDWSFTGDTWFHTVQDNAGIINSFTDLSEIYNEPGFGFGPGNFDVTERDAFDIVNARVTLENSNWVVTAWARNLTDEEYLEEVIPAPEFGGSFVHDAWRRTYGLDVTYRF
ncbi:MAG: TonB-dependent receptor [Pseudomonadota bacterium]